MEEDIKILEEIEVTNFNTSNIYLNPKKVNTAIRNLINKNKELEKMVELMAKYIQALISKYEDDTYTYTSIVDYFKKKACDEE